MIAVVLFAALFGLQSPDAKPDRNDIAQYRAESSAYVKQNKNALTYVTENRSFRFVDVLNDQGDSYEATLLLEETYHNERTDGIEGVQGFVSVRAWTMGPGGRRQTRWSFRGTGNEGAVQDRFLRVIAWGCCDVPSIYSYYSLLTGKRVYVSNAALLDVRGTGGPEASRYIAFGYPEISKLSQPPLLQYGTDKRVAQRLSVVSSRRYFDEPQVFLSRGGKLKKSLDLGDSSMTFTIVLKYQDGVELRIPVEADAIRADKAVLPKGYSLRAEG